MQILLLCNAISSIVVSTCSACVTMLFLKHLTSLWKICRPLKLEKKCKEQIFSKYLFIAGFTKMRFIFFSQNAICSLNLPDQSSLYLTNNLLRSSIINEFPLSPETNFMFCYGSVNLYLIRMRVFISSRFDLSSLLNSSFAIGCQFGMLTLFTLVFMNIQIEIYRA